MRTVSFIIFFSIFFTVYGIVNYYIFIRGLQSIPQNSSFRIYYAVCFVAVAASFILGRIGENYTLWPVSKYLVFIGSFWLAAMLYFFIGIFILDLLRFLNRFFPFFPKFVTDNYTHVKLGVFYLTVLSVGFILLAGYLNARSPVVRKLNIDISGGGPSVKSLDIVMASDIHLGTIVGKKQFDTMVATINSLSPDLLLLPGDIVDEDLKPVIRENLGESLTNIKTKFGIYAVTGNHEFIGGVDDAVRYLTDHGVRFLRDTSLLIDQTVYLTGREDRSAERFGGKTRKPLEALTKDLEKGYPVIVLDHQPVRLSESAEAGIDLQLSGHTHHGQIWPLNFITEAVYEKSWGHVIKGNTHIYVSCGAGTWGPPVRTGNRPEIVNIRLTFGIKK